MLYNEAQSARSVLNELLAVFADAPFPYELIAVDNGSTDRTGSILDGFSGRGVRVVTVAKNRGFGHGVLCGARAARGTWICFFGGDGQTNPADARALICAALQTGEDRLYSGMRTRRADGPFRLVMSAVFNRVFSRLFRLTVRDVNGTPKVLRAETFWSLEPSSERWTLDAELILGAARRGIPIAQFPVTFRPRRGGRSHVRAGTVLEFLRFMRRQARVKSSSQGGAL